MWITCRFSAFLLNCASFNRKNGARTRKRAPFAAKGYTPYSLIAPEDMPAMKYRWKNTNRINMGIEPSTLMPIIVAQS